MSESNDQDELQREAAEEIKTGAPVSESSQEKNPSDVNGVCEPCLHQLTGNGAHIDGFTIVNLNNIVAGASEIARLLQKSGELRALRDGLEKGHIEEQPIEAPLSEGTEHNLHRALEALLHEATWISERLELRSHDTKEGGAK